MLFKGCEQSHILNWKDKTPNVYMSQKSHNLCNRSHPTLIQIVSAHKSCPYCHVTPNETWPSTDQRLGIISVLSKLANYCTNVIFNIICI